MDIKRDKTTKKNSNKYGGKLKTSELVVLFPQQKRRLRVLKENPSYCVVPYNMMWKK